MLGAVTDAAKEAQWTFPSVFAQFPTWCWFVGTSDEALVAVGNAGLVAAVVAACTGWRTALFVSATCHLSLMTVGGYCDLGLALRSTCLDGLNIPA